VTLLPGGTGLYVNVDATGGRLRVALQSPDGKPLTGYGLDDAVPITGNHTGIQVRWQAGKDLPREPVRIVFELTSSSLYSFWTAAQR
jgi:hypothetical protein